ncbi:helix-hairpin-helix domain-containing protein [uncultured Mucilaginibacter sp.]|uniref:helix-hairpin-helix domain-containing protein n=1 Tax=uncultured Mucilaginibacter sp. TaxID=797541 RepID=UPI0025F08913|nr:helix-hairpin-helix domain-containing protein [uncultured Mucilaginibacter sp.]
MKARIKNYLLLTKTEWNGLIVLVLLIAGALAAPAINRRLNVEKPVKFKKVDLAVAELQRAGVKPYLNDEEEIASAHLQVKLFKFNPNKLPVESWQRLGLSLRQIKGIKNYEASGGRFITKADVKKMYTLTAEDYQRLQPYINLPADKQLNIAEHRLVVELNTADSATLTKLKGIGPAFAHRIIQYRTRLGGFYKKQQLTEVFGLDEIYYKDIQQQFTVDRKRIKKRNVNAAEYEDLKNFPYLSYKQVNAIVQYRKQHGNYESVEELSNVAIIDLATLKKAGPYLTVQ